MTKHLVIFEDNGTAIFVGDTILRIPEPGETVIIMRKRYRVMDILTSIEPPDRETDSLEYTINYWVRIAPDPFDTFQSVDDSAASVELYGISSLAGAVKLDPRKMYVTSQKVTE